VFRDRCAYAMDVCTTVEPELVPWAEDRRRACHAEAETVRETVAAS
jgi:hypothetical protein